jgi:hypothetical protein
LATGFGRAARSRTGLMYLSFGTDRSMSHFRPPMPFVAACLSLPLRCLSLRLCCNAAGDSRGMWPCLDSVGRAFDPNKLIAFNKLAGNF